MAKQVVTFFSKFTEHELVRQPRHEVPVPSGVGWVQAQPGVKYRFQPAVDESGMLVGRLDVKVGQDVLQDTAGWLAAGEDQSIERDAPTALRAHREFRHDFWQQPVPSTHVRGLIRQASVALDDEALVALLAQERAEHNRRDLISEAEDALSLVRDALATIKAAQEEAEQTPAPKAKAKPKAPAAA